MSWRGNSEVMNHLDEVLNDHLQTAIDIDLSVLHGLDVFDELVDVALDGLDLFVSETQQWSQRVE